ncbi:MAG: hypothetical protein CMP51_01555 [Flavobacteriales bacterium]|nr:hypothetical protein [Flavobacteriales bacterium]
MGIVIKQSINNSIFFYVGMTFGAISTVIGYPYAFESNEEHFGLLQTIISYSILISTFSYLGVPKTLIRFFPKLESKNELITLAFLAPVIGLLFLSFLFISFNESMLEFIKPLESQFSNYKDFLVEMKTHLLLQENIYLIFILISSLTFFEVLSSLSRCLLKSSTPIFLKELLRKGTTVFLLFLHWYIPDIIDFPTFLVLYVSQYIFMTVFLFIKIFNDSEFKMSFNFKILPLNKLLTTGFIFFLGSSLAVNITKFDMIAIQKFIGFKQVAIYTIAFFIGNVIMIPGRAVGAIASPLISKACEREDIKEISEIYRKSSLNQLLIGGLMFLIIWINIEDFFNFLPDVYRSGQLVVLFIAISQLFNISAGVNGIIITNSRYFWFDLLSTIILVIITILTNLSFIPESSPLLEYGIYGINGAAFATALSILLYNFIKMVFLYFTMHIQPFTKKSITALLLLFSSYCIVDMLPVIDNVNMSLNISIYNCFIRTLSLLLIFVPILLFLEISIEIKSTLLSLKKKILK